jgi:hypothetical protein
VSSLPAGLGWHDRRSQGQARGRGLRPLLEHGRAPPSSIHVAKEGRCCSKAPRPVASPHSVSCHRTPLQSEPGLLRGSEGQGRVINASHGSQKQSLCVHAVPPHHKQGMAANMARAGNDMQTGSARYHIHFFMCKTRTLELPTPPSAAQQEQQPHPQTEHHQH